MKEFQKFYVWGLNTKQYMGLYFSAIVFFAGIVTALYGGNSLRLTTLLQILLTSFAAAVLQSCLLPDSTDFSKKTFFGRSIFWMLSSSALVLVVSLVGGWFADLPAWCPWLLALFMLGGFTAMLWGIKLEQNADTLRLNDSLKRYQSDQL